MPWLIGSLANLCLYVQLIKLLIFLKISFLDIVSASSSYAMMQPRISLSLHGIGYHAHQSADNEDHR